MPRSGLRRPPGGATAIPRAIIDQVRDRTDIAEVVGRHVTLKRSGTSLVGLCPFHPEKTPSFNVVPHKGIFHCFGCGEGGDVFRFLMKIQGVSFNEAVKELAAAAGIQIEERDLTPAEEQRLRTRATLFDVCEEACRYYQGILKARPEGGPGRVYLQQRGLRPETWDRFRIGYAPDAWSGLVDHLHGRGFSEDLAIEAGLARRSDRRGSTYDLFRRRVMFPILDDRSRVVSFGGRIVELPDLPSPDAGQPKYLNGTDTEIYRKQRVLYGLSLARTEIQRQDRSILVEGYFDVVTLSQAGFQEVVATCGTALTFEQLEAIRRFSPRVVALFDSDEAGIKAAVRSMPLFAAAGVDALRLSLADAKDPDEHIRLHGADAFRALLNRTEPLTDTVIRFVAGRAGPTAVGRQRAVEELAPLVSRFPEVARASLVRRIADLLDLPERDVARRVARARSDARPGPQAPAAVDPPPPEAPLSPEVKDLLWLLIHHAEVVGPRIRTASPDLLDARLEVLDCLAGLLRGDSVAAVAEACPDESIRTILFEAASRTDYIPGDRAEVAVDQLFARLEADRIAMCLKRIRQEIDLGGPNRLDLVRERTTLNRRLAELRRLLPGIGR
ncbi:MAG: DNA primase [Deltaproteobacteria bacterium]|nr:DNA primase [Deltaproteobacteria bacterium]